MLAPQSSDMVRCVLVVSLGLASSGCDSSDRREPPGEATPIETTRVRILEPERAAIIAVGGDDALVRIVMFADPRCCRAMWARIGAVLRGRDDVRLLIVPLGDDAPGARAVWAAGRRGEGLSALERSGLERDAPARESPEFNAVWARSRALARELGVMGGPTYFVNGVPFVGGQWDAGTWTRVIDREAALARELLGDDVDAARLHDRINARATRTRLAPDDVAPRG